jgi:tRNA(Ile)-lysidine synthase TilS/MesJ
MVIGSKAKCSKSKYDCILGVSGGKDSTRLALWARDYLGLNPLLVCVSYPPEQLTKIGSNNLKKFTKGCR